MSLFESIQVALEAIVANKMRSILTMLGIIIGISAVITIVAIGEGSQKMIQREFETFGVSRAYLGLNWRESPAAKDYITNDDISVIKSSLGERIKGISPRFGSNGKINRRQDVINVSLLGVNEEYNQIQKFNLKLGRFIMKEDIANNRYVTIIDEGFAEKMFNRTDVIGENIVVMVEEQSLSLTIIGIQERPKVLFAEFDDDDQQATIYVPLPVMNMFMDDPDRYYSIEINLNPEADANDTMLKMKSIMERRHDAVGKNLYRTQTAESEMAVVNQVMGILTLVIGSIAAISLLVGGIGIMNIMLVSVTERTKEIGIRKAIGAKYSNIRTQFLIESLIISSIGGMIGILLGIGFSTVIALIVGFPPAVSIGAIIVATLFSAGVGVFFGYYPARKAALLDPIESLRYE